MPRAKHSDAVANSPAPRVVRARRKSADPVLAGFARHAEQVGSASQAPATPIAAPEPTIPAPAAAKTSPYAISLAISAVAICLCLAIISRSFPIRHLAEPTPTALAHNALVYHAELYDSEIVDGIRSALVKKEAAGQKLTGKDVLALIEAARPVCAKHAFTPLANALTALQSVDDPSTPQIEPSGEFDGATLRPFLDQVSDGLRSIR